MAHLSDGREKEQRKAKRQTEEDARREATRAAALELKREESPILNPGPACNIQN
jgi:hypothetical protein